MVNTLTPWLRYLALMGIVPYSGKQKWQKLQKIFTFLIIIGSFYMSIFTLIFMQVEDILILSIFVSSSVFFLQVLVMTIVLCESATTYTAHFQYLASAKYIKLLFQRELQLTVWGLPVKRYWRYLWVTIVSYGCPLSTAIIIVVFEYNYYYFWFALLAILVTRSRCLQIMLYIDHIGYYLENLALKLRAVISYRVHGEHQFLDINYTQLGSLEYLLSLKRIDNEIYKLVLQFNDMYGWSMLSIFVIFFLDIIVNLYWTILTLTDIYRFDFLCMTFSTMIPLLVLKIEYCRNCENCRKQHKIIAGHVRSLCCTTRKQVDFSIYNDLLDEFSMQIQQNAIEINAKGFLSIDYRLLMSMFTAMVTYLIILMQFRITDTEYIQRSTGLSTESTFC